MYFDEPEDVYGGGISEHEFEELALLRAVIKDYRCFNYKASHRQESSGREALILTLNLSVPQRINVDIRSQERIAIVMDEKWDVPRVYPCRDDFDKTLGHLNQCEFGENVWLCLDERTSAEQKLYWRPAHYLESVIDWFERTAAGNLHEESRVLEPVFFSAHYEVSVQPSLFILKGDKSCEKWFWYHRKPGELITRHIGSVVTSRQATRALSRGEYYNAVVVYDTEALTHGRVHTTPRTLAQLKSILGASDLDQTLLKYVSPENLKAYKGFPLLLVRIPVRRTDDAPVERLDVHGYLLGSQQDKIVPGTELRGLLERGERVSLIPVSIHVNFNQGSARQYNDFDEESDRSICLYGCGALGSQMLETLCRQGSFQRIFLCDKDWLNPHNLARHDLDSSSVGEPKTAGCAKRVRQILGDSVKVETMHTDALGFVDFNQVHHDCELVIDAMASAPATRHLAYLQRSSDLASNTRIATVFLSPNGHHLVAYLQGTETPRVDATTLEMESLLMLLEFEELSTFFEPLGEPIRYAGSCSHPSAKLRSSEVAMFAAIAAGFIEEHAERIDALVVIWSWNDHKLEHCQRSPAPWHMFPLETGSGGEPGTTVFIRPSLLERARRLRKESLPNETGGILIGTWDRERKSLYLVTLCAEPEDSKSSPSYFERGSQGVTDALDEIGRRTYGQLEYVGEWHSHPRDISARPSSKDIEQFEELERRGEGSGIRGFMLIIAEDEMCLLFGDFEYKAPWTTTIEQ